MSKNTIKINDIEEMLSETSPSFPEFIDNYTFDLLNHFNNTESEGGAKRRIPRPKSRSSSRTKTLNRTNSPKAKTSRSDSRVKSSKTKSKSIRSDESSKTKSKSTRSDESSLIIDAAKHISDNVSRNKGDRKLDKIFGKLGDLTDKSEKMMDEIKEIKQKLTETSDELMNEIKGIKDIVIRIVDIPVKKTQPEEVVENVVEDNDNNDNNKNSRKYKVIYG